MLTRVPTRRVASCISKNPSIGFLSIFPSSPCTNKPFKNGPHALRRQSCLTRDLEEESSSQSSTRYLYRRRYPHQIYGPLQHPPAHHTPFTTVTIATSRAIPPRYFVLSRRHTIDQLRQSRAATHDSAWHLPLCPPLPFRSSLGLSVSFSLHLSLPFLSLPFPLIHLLNHILILIPISPPPASPPREERKPSTSP
jgi:hypothetical protein